MKAVYIGAIVLISACNLLLLPCCFGQSDMNLAGKFQDYTRETYLNPSVFTAPAFTATITMAAPPGKGPTRYPSSWRQGAAGFARNYGDAATQRITYDTARFAADVLFREDPRYSPSTSHHVLVRVGHALAFTIVDRSDSGHAMPALGNFAGAAAAGFVGNAYLPDGFSDRTHVTQRISLRLAYAAGANLFREFAFQMPRPARTAIMLIGR